MTQPDPAAPTGGAIPKTTGYKSTEAWLTAFKALVTSAIAFCTLFGVAVPTWLRPDAPWIGIAALVVGGAVTSLYGKDRTDLKKLLVARLVDGSWQVSNVPAVNNVNPDASAAGDGAAPWTDLPAQPDPDPAVIYSDDPPADAPPPGAERAEPDVTAPAGLGLPDPPPFLSTPQGRAAVRRGAAAVPNPSRTRR